jgi:phage gpG-like protein
MYTVEIKDEALRAALARLTAGFDDLFEPFDEIGQNLVLSAKDRIDDGISPDGTAFAPRSATTLERYGKLPLSIKGGPLKWQGDMQGGIFHQASATGVEYGSNAIQSAVMQFGATQGQFGTTARGGSIPWGNIPARPFIGLSTDDNDMILETLEEWIGGLATGP